MARGYDFRFGYNSGYKAPYDLYDDQDGIIEGQCGKLREHLDIDPMRFVPTASCFCDPTPRFTERWNSLGYRFREWMNIWYLEPERFRDLLEKMKAMTDLLPDGA